MVLSLVLLPLVSVEGSGWMHGARSGTAVSVLSCLSLWFKEGEIAFYPSEFFRKIKWTNAKITGNSCYHSISSLCLGSVLQQRARVLQSLSNLDFPLWKFKYKTQGGIRWQCATSLPLHRVKFPSWHPTHCAPAVGDGSNAASRSPCPNKTFNWFCLQFSSFLLPCGNTDYFVKQDNLRLHWQLPTSLLKPIALFMTNLSAHSIQQKPHQCERKQESLTAFNNIFLFQPSIFRVLMLELLDFCLVLLFGEQDCF